jgi:hypothetical protein
MNHRRLRRAVELTIALCLQCAAARAATPDWVPETGALDRETARSLARALIEDVETRALRPRIPAEYEAAKERLVALVNSPAPNEPRAAVYGAAREMLSTLDTDGHTLLWSNEQTSTWQNATRPESAGDLSTVRTIPMPGKPPVLVLRPAQATFMDAPSARTYALEMIDQIHRRIVADDPCGIVVDLGAQQGGAAWPVIAALAPLITSANAARLVDRDGARSPIVLPGAVEWATGAALPRNDLVRFAGRPLAIVLTAQTASAGEMVAVILRGESGARTFGLPTYGATTSNVPTALPDGATVLLTTSRYAYGKELALRGPLVPDVPAVKGEAPEATLLRAATWAAQTCPQREP